VPARLWSGAGELADAASVAEACLLLGLWTTARRVLERAARRPPGTAEDRAAWLDAWQQYCWWTGQPVQPRPPADAPVQGRTPAEPPQVVGVIRDVQAALDRRDFDLAAARIAWLGRLPGSRAGSWFTAYDDEGEPARGDGRDADVSVRAWAEIIRLSASHILGIRPAEDGVHVRPRLLPGIDHLGARLRVRRMALRLDIDADESVGAETEYLVPYGDGEVALRLGARAQTASR
jgi:hypothetical protein